MNQFWFVSVKIRIIISFSITTLSWSNLPGEEFIFKCSISTTFLSFNLLNIEGVSHYSSKLPKLHVSSSKMTLSEYTPPGAEFALNKIHLNRL